MPDTKRPLKIFLYCIKDDLPKVQALEQRLHSQGVRIIALNETDTEPAAEEHDPIQAAVHEADLVVFCLSRQFNKLASLKNAEWRSVLEAVRQKRHGDMLLLPVALEECNAPKALKRWQPVNLFERNGYENLMFALKLRADKLSADLEASPEWKKNPFATESSSSAAGTAAARPSFAWLAWIGFAALIIAFILFQRNARNAAETTETLDELSQRATQNVLALTAERAATSTVEAFQFESPRTQTAVFLTTVEPLTQTAAASIKTATVEQSLITPTITLTSVALPTQIIDSSDSPMALVPEGDFNMGWDEDADSQPTHKIYLPAYYMDMYEVTNAQYKNCADVGACPPPTDASSQTRAIYYGSFEFANYPVIYVNWQMAQTYCEWRGAHLPTEAEWEKAARGTERFMYPWGDEPGCIFANHNNCLGDTTSVDKYLLGASAYGILNLSGNVLEWTSSVWKDYPYNADDGREDPASLSTRVLRGGSWASLPANIFTYRRLNLDPYTTRNDIGFRCARSVGE